jgi:hypothetical protein
MERSHGTIVLLSLLVAGSQAGCCVRTIRKPTTTDLLQAVRNADLRAVNALRMSVTVTSPRDPLGVDTSGYATAYTLTIEGGARALSAETTYEAAPRYSPPPPLGAPGGDHDQDHNLLVWRPTRKLALSSPDQDAIHEEADLVVVTPAGTVIRRAPLVYLLRYPLRNREGTVDFDRILTALGRGYGDQLETITEERTSSQGSLEIRGRGYARLLGLHGTWALTLDPAAGHLVRHAEFVADGESKVGLTAASAATAVSDGATMAQSGTLTIPLGPVNLVFAVRLDHLAREADQALLARVRAALAAQLPEGAGIVDMSVDPPSRTTVGEVVFQDHKKCCDCHPVDQRKSECLHFVGAEDLGCLSKDCISNWMRSATCVLHDQPPPPDCRWRERLIEGFMQTIYRLPANHLCPNAPANVDYREWLTLHECQLDPRDLTCALRPFEQVVTACEVTQRDCLSFAIGPALRYRFRGPLERECL